MGKKHDTFPGEQEEFPQPKTYPEVTPPTDPGKPEIPREDPGQSPVELPPETTPQEDPAKPGETNNNQPPAL